MKTSLNSPRFLSAGETALVVEFGTTIDPAIHERVLGADHPYVAVSLHNLAKTLRELGDPAAARPPAERAVAVDERTYGPDHPEVATDLDVLADILRDLDDHEAAQIYRICRLDGGQLGAFGARATRRE